MTKKEIIENLKEWGYVMNLEYGNDWEAIAREVGEGVIYDEDWCIAFTTSYCKVHMKHIEPDR